MNNFTVFCNQIVFVSSGSFLQNKKVCKNIRKYVNENIDGLKNIITIGGEGYLIGLTNNNVKSIINYTNSKSIYNDVNFNNIFYKKIKLNMLINYNEIKALISDECLVINLANLNQNLMKIINKTYYEKIIIINCHAIDFWKKIKLLTNYKLKSREQFITNNNFITVNIFKRKYEIVSLGGNCAVSYHLNKYKLRKNSYPFDWSKLSINQLNIVLKNKFQDYNKVYKYKFSENHKLIETDLSQLSFIYKNKYNVTFAHELYNEYECIEYKLQYRIQRFINLEDPIFIYFHLNNKKIDKSVMELYNNLYKYFKDFRLVIICKEKLYKNEENKNILLFTFNEFNDDWKYDNINWREILTNISNNI